MKRRVTFSLFFLIAMAGFAHDPRQQQAQGSPGDLAATTEIMSHQHHHEMGPHMHMSVLRNAQPAMNRRHRWS